MGFIRNNKSMYLQIISRLRGEGVLGFAIKHAKIIGKPFKCSDNGTDRFQKSSRNLLTKLKTIICSLEILKPLKPN